MKQLGLQEGDIIVAGAEHSCLAQGDICVVHVEGGDKFVFCADGIHELNEDEDGEIVGFHIFMNGMPVI